MSDVNAGKPRLTIRPINLREANAYVDEYHRHHRHVQGQRFSVSVYDGERLCGVAIVGRPVSPNSGHPLEVLEVTRLCTDGTPNACSALYSAAARVGRELGYKRIQTFILDTEPGTSLRAAGWTDEGPAGGGKWNHRESGGRVNDHPVQPKQRWARKLND